MTTFFAVCNVGGPISVLLNGETLEEARESFFELDQRQAIDNAMVDAEDDLGIEGSGMSEEEFAEALEEEGAELVEGLDVVHNYHSGRTDSVKDGWALWKLED